MISLRSRVRLSSLLLNVQQWPLTSLGQNCCYSALPPGEQRARSIVALCSRHKAAQQAAPTSVIVDPYGPPGTDTPKRLTLDKGYLQYPPCTRSHGRKYDADLLATDTPTSNADSHKSQTATSIPQPAKHDNRQTNKQHAWYLHGRRDRVLKPLEQPRREHAPIWVLSLLERCRAARHL